MIARHGGSGSPCRPHSKGTTVISDSSPTPREDSADVDASVDEQEEPAGAENAGNGVALTTDDDAQRGDEQPIKTDNA